MFCQNVEKGWRRDANFVRCGEKADKGDGLRQAVKQSLSKH